MEFSVEDKRPAFSTWIELQNAGTVVERVRDRVKAHMNTALGSTGTLYTEHPCGLIGFTVSNDLQ